MVLMGTRINAFALIFSYEVEWLNLQIRKLNLIHSTLANAIFGFRMCMYNLFGIPCCPHLLNRSWWCQNKPKGFSKQHDRVCQQCLVLATYKHFYGLYIVHRWQQTTATATSTSNEGSKYELLYGKTKLYWFRY